MSSRTKNGVNLEFLSRAVIVCSDGEQLEETIGENWCALRVPTLADLTNFMISITT